MRHTEPSSPLQAMLLMPSPTWMERLVGRVAWLAAGLLTLVACLAVLMVVAAAWSWATGVRSQPSPQAQLVVGVVLLAVSSAMAWFLNSTGKRLLSGRFNDQGSIASPTAWLVCCVAFLALALVAAAVAIINRDLGAAQAAAGGGLLALLAYGAWSHFRRIRVRPRQTPG